MLPAVVLLAQLAAASPSYAGEWTLDLRESRGLPEFYSDVKRHALSIAQSDSLLDVRVVMEVGSAPADTMRFPYRLDGRATETQTPVRTPNGPRPVPTTLRATVGTDGGVHIVITRAFTMGTMGTQTMRSEMAEDWRLGADGRTLLIHLVGDTPRGRIESDLVFRRVSGRPCTYRTTIREDIQSTTIP